MTYTDIQEQFNKVISYSQGIDNPQTDSLFKAWYSAKKPFIEAFGGKLIYEIEEPVQFTLDRKAKLDCFNAFVDAIYSTYRNDALGAFLEREVEGFYSNVVTEDYECSRGKITKGTKLIKAFKYFEDDKCTLHFLQDYASRIIQGNKIEGKLCFSVHPLDYLSSSENTYNWRSCHSLDGDYRAGNLSYMLDHSTVICYLKGADNVQLPHFHPCVKWNSKKWRMLLFFSQGQNVVFAGRQYPFSSMSALELIRHNLLNTMFVNNKQDHWMRDSDFGPWRNQYINSETIDYQLYDSYIPICGKLVPLNTIIQDDFNAGYEPLHFNDLLRSSCYTTPFYSVKAYSTDNEADMMVCVGSIVPCLSCEKNMIIDSDLMVCEYCDEGEILDNLYCECCSTSMPDNEACYLQDGTIVCGYCFENECFVCADCREAFYNSDKIYDKKTNDFICSNCHNDRIKEE